MPIANRASYIEPADLGPCVAFYLVFVILFLVTTAILLAWGARAGGKLIFETLGFAFFFFLVLDVTRELAEWQQFSSTGPSPALFANDQPHGPRATHRPCWISACSPLYYQAVIATDRKEKPFQTRPKAVTRQR